MAAATTVGAGDSLFTLGHAGAAHRTGWLNSIKLALAVTTFGEGAALLLVDVHNLTTRSLNPIINRKGTA